MRHAMKVGVWKPLLALGGGVRRWSYVDVGLDEVVLRFGVKEERIPRGAIESADHAKWPWYGGIGWRVGADALGLIGALSGIVEVRLHEKRSTFVLIPWRYRRLFVSLEDPAAFLRDLHAPTPGAES